MRITVLGHVEKEGSRKCDVAVRQVAQGLRTLGHDVSILLVCADVKKLFRGLGRSKPDMVFNLAETFGSSELGAVALTGFLDLMELPYTGVGPGETYLQEDKVLTKKLLAYHGILYPDFVSFSKDAGFETGGNLRMPLMVKPLRMDASIGIDAGSVVHTVQELIERVSLIHRELSDTALAEEYIEGREFYVGIIGNNEPVAFPPIEMDFSDLPAGHARIVDSKAKWDKSSAEYNRTNAVVARISEELSAKLQKVAVEAYLALRVRDYGRIDLRLSTSGEIYVIEVNANCHLERASEFPLAAQANGIEYPELLARIIDTAMSRHASP